VLVVTTLCEVQAIARSNEQINDLNLGDQATIFDLVAQIHV
jgi:hypothetical protein